MDAAMKEFLGVGESLTFYSLIVDFAIASLFLLIGQWIRAKVRIVQKFFLPASILAGFMGLFRGQHFLNVLLFSGAQSQYATYLIVIVFTIVGVDEAVNLQTGTLADFDLNKSDAATTEQVVDEEAVEAGEGSTDSVSDYVD